MKESKSFKFLQISPVFPKTLNAAPLLILADSQLNLVLSEKYLACFLDKFNSFSQFSPELGRLSFPTKGAYGKTSVKVYSGALAP